MFNILAEGNWLPGRVKVTWSDTRRPVVDEVERAIDVAWAAAARPGVQLFDGPMCRVVDFHAAPAELRLTLSATSYKPFLGTNLTNAHFAEKYGRNVLANPLGASVALVTVDGYLLLGRRGDRVAYYPNRVHPFAGALEPAEADDVFAVAYRELEEELNLPRERLGNVRCIGIAQDVSLLQHEIIFAAETDRTRSQVEALLDPEEHDAVWAIRADTAALDDAVRDKILTPVAAATITLWRRGTGL